MICRHCGFSNREGIRFCENCGEPFPTHATKEKQNKPGTLLMCSECNFENRVGVIFCEQCGAKLKPLPKPQLPVRSQKPERNSKPIKPKCSKCGFENSSEYKFCLKCGNPIKIERNLWINTAELISTQKLKERFSATSRVKLVGIISIVAISLTTILLFIFFGSNLDIRKNTSQPPELNAGDIQNLLNLPELSENDAFEPWNGFTIELENAKDQYVYEGNSWAVFTEGGDVWGLPIDSARIIEQGDGLVIVNESSESKWATEILLDTPGLRTEGSGYKISSLSEYRDGLIQTAIEHGASASPNQNGEIVLTRRQERPIVWVEPRDDHIWIIDNTAAVLLVQSGEELAVVGRFVPDSLSGAVWEPAPNTEILKDSVEQVLNQIEGIESTGLKRRIPFKVFVPGTVDPIRVDKIPTNKGPSISIHVAQVPKEKCSFFNCIKKKVAGVSSDVGNGITAGVKKGFDVSVNATENTLDSIDMSTATCVVTALGCTITTIDKISEITEPVWKPIGNVFVEKNCHAPGPGTEASPTTFDYPVRGYSLDQFTSSDWSDQLSLARQWMPSVEFSKYEQCGEIIRVIAKVFPYTAQGNKTKNLSDASYVEIAYTLFFREDGGRFRLQSHPGDNEGFVIGLARTKQRTGLCSTGFEFVGGRTVAHSNKGGPVVEYFDLNSQQIDDFGPSQVGSPCPTPNISNKQEPWKLLISENKHGLYYHRDKCEAALGPRLPTLIPALLSLPPEGALASDWFISMAPADIAEDLSDGLEECESGRSLVSLSDRVELYADDLAEIRNSGLNFEDTYLTDSGSKTFAEQSRGRACQTLKMSAPQGGTVCDEYVYHIPGLFTGIAVDPSLKALVPTKIIPTKIPPTKIIPTIRTVQVPDVSMKGYTPEYAKSILENYALQMTVKGYVDVSKSEDGLVVSQDPHAGETLGESDIVNVWVGKYSSPVTVQVPYLIGMTQWEAQSRANENGLTIEISGEIPVNTEFVDTVIDQSPLQGSIDEGGVIYVWMGVQNYVTSPDVGGLPEADAKSRINAEGLIPVFGGTILITDPSYDGRVVDQQPDPYSSVPSGSVIKYWLGSFSVDFPDKRKSNLVKISITGGHGSYHQVGDVVQLCVEWSAQGGEPPDRWEIWDYQPADGEGAFFTDGSMLESGSNCFNATIQAPLGFERLIIVDRKYDYGTSSWKVRDWADVWIYIID